MAEGRGEEGWVDGDNLICVILKFAMTTNNLIEYILLNKKKCIFMLAFQSIIYLKLPVIEVCSNIVIPSTNS